MSAALLLDSCIDISIFTLSELSIFSTNHRPAKNCDLHWLAFSFSEWKWNCLCLTILIHQANILFFIIEVPDYHSFVIQTMGLVKIGFFLFDGVQTLDFIGPWVCDNNFTPLSFCHVNFFIKRVCDPYMSQISNGKVIPLNWQFVSCQGCFWFVETVLQVSSWALYLWGN